MFYLDQPFLVGLVGFLCYGEKPCWLVWLINFFNWPQISLKRLKKHLRD